MVGVLVAFYFAMVITFMTLYMFYYTHVRADPGFSYTHNRDDLEKPLYGVIGFAAILLVVYYIWYFTVLIIQIRNIMLTSLI